MQRVGPWGTVLVALGIAGFGGACRFSIGKMSPEPDASRPAPAPLHANPPAARADAGGGPTRTADMPRLPEDPEAGRRSQAQWRQHLDHEEYERQLAFDKRSLAQHRTVVARLRRARARLDGARSAAAVKGLADETGGAVTELRLRIERLDHWGVNSRLLGEYDALVKILDGNYAAGRIAELGRDPRPMAALRAEWDRHMKVVDDWLTEAANAETD